MGARKTSAAKAAAKAPEDSYAKCLVLAKHDHDADAKAGRRKQSEDKKMQAPICEC